MTTLKEIRANLDCFKDYVSYAEKIIPSEASPTRKINSINWSAVMASGVNKISEHKDGDITVKTNAGNIRFWLK